MAFKTKQLILTSYWYLNALTETPTNVHVNLDIAVYSKLNFLLQLCVKFLFIFLFSSFYGALINN